MFSARSDSQPAAVALQHPGHAPARCNPGAGAARRPATVSSVAQFLEADGRRRRRGRHGVENPVAHGGEQFVLVLDVPVQGHRGDAEILRDPPDGNGVQAVEVGDGQRVIDDRLPGQRPRIPDASVVCGKNLRNHVDNCTP